MGILFSLDKHDIDKNSTVEEILYGLKDKILIEYYTDDTDEACTRLKPTIEKLKSEYGKYFDMNQKVGKLLKLADGTFEFKQAGAVKCARGAEIYELPTLIISNKTEEIFVEGVQPYDVYVSCLKKLNKDI
ncbi:MAG: hypothetical protein FWC53_02600 [Firmicutes bacterium]|nr:hypothetical protein [Bacillota bacterium]